jgi:hypothetical protein
MLMITISAKTTYRSQPVFRGAEAGALSAPFAPRLHHVSPISARTGA